MEISDEIIIPCTFQGRIKQTARQLIESKYANSLLYSSHIVTAIKEIKFGDMIIIPGDGDIQVKYKVIVDTVNLQVGSIVQGIIVD